MRKTSSPFPIRRGAISFKPVVQSGQSGFSELGPAIHKGSKVRQDHKPGEIAPAFQGDFELAPPLILPVSLHGLQRPNGQKAFCVKSFSDSKEIGWCCERGLNSGMSK